MKEILLSEIITPVLISDTNKIITHLKQSIKKLGVLMPIDVREHQNGGYTILNGRSRVKACRILGMKTIPANVYSLTDQEAMEATLLAPTQCVRTDKVTYAKQLRRLVAQHPEMTKAEIAAKLGKSVSWLNETLKNAGE